ncbi:unnamed protein product, partial [marine sediment metagenome]
VEESGTGKRDYESNSSGLRHWQLRAMADGLVDRYTILPLFCVAC